MESRIMQVFYGNDCLPYKDSARSVHYPIVGNSFIGANNTTQIRFYVRDIGGVNNVSWVAISKLPNGKIGNEVLSSIHLDSELNEYYVALDLSSYYTQVKGDVYISLNGYQGQVQVEQDSDTGIYTIVGTPLIEATGSIKLAINYAPQLPLGQHFNISDLQQVLGLISEKANVVNTVQVVADISQEDLTGYDLGQLFYCLTNKQYYEKKATSPYYDVAESGNGILGSKRALIRYEVNFATTTINEILGFTGSKNAIISSGLLTDYFIKSGLDLSFHSTIRVVNLNTLETWFATSEQLPFSNYINALITDTYKDTILHESNYKNFAVPYIGATDSVDLGEHYLKAKKFYIDSLDKFIQVLNGNLIIGTGNGDLILSPDGDSYLGSNSTDAEKIATRGHVSSVVAAAIATLKTNAFILVNTTTYPTLNDFLASTGEEGYIYLYPSTNEEEEYLKYIWEENSWLMIGTTQIDLTNYYTKPQVNAIANGKVDKTSSVSKLYGTNASGNQTTISFTSSNNGSTIPLRDNDGNIGVALTPTNNMHSTSKKYVDDQIDTKLDKTSNNHVVYATDGSGNQTTFEYDTFVNGQFVRRVDSNSGNIYVGNPTAMNHATPKSYVDNAISNAISNVYKIKGSKTVAEINALTGMVAGDVYNVTDSGTITLGNLQVFTGDNIVWTGSAWDKLGAEIDWSAYDEKFIAAGFFEVDNYNENSGEITFIYATELYDMSYDSDTGIMTIQAN